MSDLTRQWLVEKPVMIALYIVLALLVRWVLHRGIDKVTAPSADGSPSAWRRRRQEKSDQRAEASASGPGPDGPHEEVTADESGGLTAAVLRKNNRRRSAEHVRTEHKRAERRAQRMATIGSVLKSIVSFAVLVWVVLQTLAILGVNVAPFIASAGIVGVALGFGAQALVRDFLSGLFMLFEDQYGVGDWVDLGEAEGTVEHVGLRVTSLRDLHGTLWYCRNGDIQRVGNYSQDFGVAFLEIPVSYTADVDRACTVAIETAKQAAREEPIASNLISGPELQGVNALDADFWSLRMTAVTQANAQWATERELRRRIRNAFDEAGIDAPYPEGLPVSAMRAMASE
ncbi:mechanosensitive ion channel family protein [Dietzia sp. B32]|uniref:mechanosensitive ion channel family protein n=1 Tax=Dietzia sp. B32 TaxID=2915130 RepID=UPI0021ADAA95|nr:mechanosensitive ion channel family protein [Dietzia sp. B32]UVE96912.1 mechanosensitive ion channel family protein [Dietzia sp. B32]